MKHARSSAEWEIRDALVAHLRVQMPKARVVHELVCGSNRADVAAIEPDWIVLFEIKSERDVLARTAKQMETFRQAAHAAVLVAHIKWFDQKPYANGSPRLAWPADREYGTDIWCYPEQESNSYPLTYRWRLPARSYTQPHARLMLDMLHKAELIEECGRHRISTSARSTCHDMIEQMVWLMTGREICQAVCRQLRARHFPEADAAINYSAVPA
ncbi:hypothetical protein [Mesorhizobium sp.]|uniref:hypothetical protein n=1 Tax=Mesorhizobium sp. TaxID=1871066 RepID=UPI0012223493|nr:hypothetical protein [Mesorhizobium sp.]TIL30008.1 MAG: hypothetical protein E5Y85_25610 [Mesorhizobium sp.]